jgi:Zn-dependent M28 family amino/carboxypeptidase
LDAAEQQLTARLRAHVEKLGGEIGARSLPTAPGNLEKAATYIEEQFQQAGLSPSRQTFSVSGYFRDGMFGASHATQSTSNIIVEIPGTTNAAEIVVIGAHYDSVLSCPAANDNGSGVAAMLEIARALAKEKFSRTVRFVAFTNEEPPFFRSDDMGSYRYAQSCKERGDKIIAMLSLETIGYYTDEPNTQHFPIAALAMLYPTTGNFISFVGNPDSQQLLNSCIKSFNAAVKFPSEALAMPADVPGVDFSDNLSFWRVGYPAIMVTDTAPYRYPHYHKDTDTPDKVNYDNLARVTSGLTQVVHALVSSDARS